MTFSNPHLLPALFLLIPFAAVLFLRYRKRRRETVLFTENAPQRREFKSINYRLRMIFSDCFFTLFLALSITALCSPKWGQAAIIDYSRGIDVIIAFDLSRSMNVKDSRNMALNTEPVSRLDRSISIAGELGLGLDGVRIGTVIGKGRGILTLPLTYDTEAFLNFLDGLNEFSITGGGTNLESIIDTASSAFKDNMPGKRCVFLFSDGEELEGSFNDAVNRAAARGIIICTVGIGSDLGGAVPLEDGNFLMSGGQSVLSARKSEALRIAAEKTEGIYIDGNRQDAAAQAGNFLKTLSADSGLLGIRREEKNQSHVFIIAALLSLCLSRSLGFTFRRKVKKTAAGEGAQSTAVLVCLVVFASAFSLFSGSCSRMEGKLLVMEGNYHQNRGFHTDAVAAYLNAMEFQDSAPYAEYGLGSAYFALEETKAALERYKAAEKYLDEFPRDQHPELRFRLKYNMGILYFELGDYEEASRAFRSALETDGSRVEAKRNLELSLLSLVPAAASTPAMEEELETNDNNSGEAGDASLVLFEYLREREQNRWKSRVWTEETSFSGPDY